MGILSRIRRLALSNLKDLVEKAKDPEVELLEFAAEVERCYGEIKAEMVDASSAAARLERQLNETRAEAEKWRAKAGAAARLGDDELAREALKRRSRTETLAAHIGLHLREQNELADAFRSSLEDLHNKLQEVQTQRDLLLARGTRSRAAQRVAGALASRTLWGEDAAVERLAEEILERKSRAEAARELYASRLETQLARLEGGQEIEAELAKLKGRKKR